MQKSPAASQPTSRGPTAEAGWATATGSTKTSSAAVDPVAAWGERIPAKSTQNPTTAMATTAATLSVETTVPTAMKQPPTTEEAEVGDQSGAGSPGEVDQEQEGERTEGAEQAGLGVGEEQVGEAEHQGHDHRGPDRPLDGQESGVLLRQPCGHGRP